MRRSATIVCIILGAQFFGSAGALFAAMQAEEYHDADRTDIPAAYLGTWALDRKFCEEPGPAVVTISSRKIDFYERHGHLDLAQINYAPDVPSFYGHFRWVELLRFSDGVARLEMRADGLHITENGNPDAATNRAAWLKCP